MKNKTNSFEELRAIDADALKRQPDIEKNAQERESGMKSFRESLSKGNDERKKARVERAKKHKIAETERLKRVSKQIINPSGDKA